MPHNGKINQGNFGWGTYWGKGFEFINVAKLIAWSFAPDKVNANGYPTVDTSGNGQFWVPTQTDRPGKYIVEWTGDCNMSSNFNNGSITSGSNNPTGSAGSKHGTFTFRPVSTPVGNAVADNILFSSMNVSEPLTYLAIFHEDDEAAYRAGEWYTQAGLNMFSDYGVLRTLDNKFHNNSMVCLWEHENPETAMSFGPRSPPGKFYGTTTSSGNDFSLAKTGFSLMNCPGILGGCLV